MKTDTEKDISVPCKNCERSDCPNPFCCDEYVKIVEKKDGKM